MESILERIYSAAIRFLNNQKSQNTYKTIANEAKKLVDADYGSIFIEHKGRLERVYATSKKLFTIKIKKGGNIYKCFRLNKTLLLSFEDVANLSPLFGKLEIKSIVLIPLCSQRKPIGVLSVLSVTKKTFNQEDLDALKLFGAFANLAITKNKLSVYTQDITKERNQLRSQENILEKIHKSALKFMVKFEPKELYQLIVKEAINLVNAQYGSLLIKLNNKLELVYTNMPLANQMTIRKKGFTHRVMKDKKPLIKESQKYQNSKIIWEELGIASTIFIPLVYKNESIGVLRVNSYENSRFSEDELEILKLYGSLSSLALKNTELFHDTRQALATRDIFISMAAHKLRTPLTVISGYIQMLNKRFSGVESAEEKWTQELSWHTFRMTQMLNEMLSVNKIQSGKLNYAWQECDLLSIIQQAIDDFRMIHPTRGVLFEHTGSNGQRKIIADREKLEQVVANLLDNAAKFSAPDKPIRVILKYRYPYNSLAIKDQGIGMSQEELVKLFDNLYVGKTHSKEGMGFGLFLAKKILESHRGFISIKSTLNKGTQVEIRLPRTKI